MRDGSSKFASLKFLIQCHLQPITILTDGFFKAERMVRYLGQLNKQKTF
jgi:hypothetical protein